MTFFILKTEGGKEGRKTGLDFLVFLAPLFLGVFLSPKKRRPGLGRLELLFEGFALLLGEDGDGLGLGGVGREEAEEVLLLVQREHLARPVVVRGVRGAGQELQVLQARVRLSVVPVVNDEALALQVLGRHPVLMKTHDVEVKGLAVFIAWLANARVLIFGARRGHQLVSLLLQLHVHELINKDTINLDIGQLHRASMGFDTV